MVEKKLVAQEMTRLGAVFNRAVDKATMAAYYEAIRHLNPEELTHAVKLAVERERFFPAPAVLLEYAAETPKASKNFQTLSPATLAALPEEAREAYIRDRDSKGLPKVGPGPAEAAVLVKDIRRRSGLDRAAE